MSLSLLSTSFALSFQLPPIYTSATHPISSSRAPSPLSLCLRRPLVLVSLSFSSFLPSRFSRLQSAMKLVDVAHRSLVLGLVGITVYYGAFVTQRSNSVIERYNAHKAATKADAAAAAADNTS